MFCTTGYYFSGDGAHRTQNGYYRITGRMDDVINVSGHRLGTAEVEDVLVGITEMFSKLKKQNQVSTSIFEETESEAFKYCEWLVSSASG